MSDPIFSASEHFLWKKKLFSMTFTGGTYPEQPSKYLIMKVLILLKIQNNRDLKNIILAKAKQDWNLLFRIFNLRLLNLPIKPDIANNPWIITFYTRLKFKIRRLISFFIRGKTLWTRCLMKVGFSIKLERMTGEDWCHFCDLKFLWSLTIPIFSFEDLKHCTNFHADGKSDK